VFACSVAGFVVSVASSEAGLDYSGGVFTGVEAVPVPVGRGVGVVFTGSVEVPVLVIGDTSGFCAGTCASPAPVIFSLFAAFSFSSVSMASFSRTVTPWSWAIRLAMASTSFDVR